MGVWGAYQISRHNNVDDVDDGNWGNVDILAVKVEKHWKVF